MSKLIEIPKDKDPIEVRKIIAKYQTAARKSAKPNKCILCGKEIEGTCNSHSVPQLSLKTIANKGKILQASALVGIDFLDDISGVNNSGTFHLICRNCDASFFQDYENVENLHHYPTDKMLGEIAAKNVLLQLSKRYVEKELFDDMQELHGSKTDLDFKHIQDVKNLDIRDYTEDFNLHKSIVENNQTGGYQILFWKLLPYNVPLAAQSVIAPQFDMEGNELLDIYNMSESIRIPHIDLAILPIGDATVALLFYHKKDRVFRKLRHQMNSSSEEKQLQFINYLVFAYAENYFFSDSISNEIKINEKLQQLSQESNGIPNMGMLNAKNMFGFGYSPVAMDEIPNFLLAEWKL